MLLLASLVILFSLVRTDDPLRPQYHLMPVNSWLNDPNGPVYYNGYYHMFFQNTPDSAVRGLMHWVSTVNQGFFFISFIFDAGSLLQQGYGALDASTSCDNTRSSI